MSLLKKMRVNTKKPLWLINEPEDCLRYFEEAEELKKGTGGKVLMCQVILFAENSVKLNALADKIADRVDSRSLIWVAYPKKGSKLEADLHRDKVWEQMFSQFEGVASVSIDETWTGMRFRKKDPLTESTWIPMEERKTEGIDYVARTVKLPPDAEKEIRVLAGLEDFFYSMSFSHKREYVEAIVEAKMPETRQRRIEAMIKKLQEMREAKEKKGKTKKK